LHLSIFFLVVGDTKMIEKWSTRL